MATDGHRCVDKFSHWWCPIALWKHRISWFAIWALNSAQRQRCKLRPCWWWVPVSHIVKLGFCSQSLHLQYGSENDAPGGPGLGLKNHRSKMIQCLAPAARQRDRRWASFLARTGKYEGLQGRLPATEIGWNRFEAFWSIVIVNEFYVTLSTIPDSEAGYEICIISLLLLGWFVSSPMLLAWAALPMPKQTRSSCRKALGFPDSFKDRVQLKSHLKKSIPEIVQDCTIGLRTATV